MVRRILVWLAAAGTAGCYTFVPAGAADLEPGQNVRARVTGAFSDQLRATIPTGDTRTLEGVVVEGLAAATLIDVPVDRSLQGMQFETLNQRIEIPNEEFIEVEIKELDRGRTLLAAGGLGAVVGVIVVAQLTGDSGGGRLPGGGGPVDAVVSFPVGRATLRALSRVLGR